MFTTQIPRSKLAQLAGNDLVLIKYFENLFPDLQSVTTTAQNALDLATIAEADAQEAILQIGLAFAKAHMAQRAANEALEAALMEQSAMLNQLRSYVRVLESRVSALEYAP